MIKTKNKIKNKINPVKQRKLKIRAKKGMLAAKLIIIALILFLAGLLYSSIDKINKEFYQTTANLGFIVKNVTVEGQHYTSSEELSKAIKIKSGMPIFSISLQDLKTRLEALEWIKHVIVERILPDNIHISIVERKPIALGQKDRKLYLIDDEGAIINEKNLKEYLHLPIIIGDGAEIYASSLIEMLKTEPDLFKHITSITRVSERRWNLKFNNGLEIKMPELNIERAWKIVINLYKKQELFKPDIAAIDLRIPNKIFVEKK